MSAFASVSVGELVAERQERVSDGLQGGELPDGQVPPVALGGGLVEELRRGGRVPARLDVSHGAPPIRGWP